MFTAALSLVWRLKLNHAPTHLTYNHDMDYTLKTIGDALGVKRQTITWYLRGIEAADFQLTMGNKAAAWRIDQFPKKLFELLATKARKQRCRGATDADRIAMLLAMPRMRWDLKTEFNLSWDEICDDHQQQAASLMQALQPFLLSQHDTKLSPGEFKKAGVAEYKRIFRNTITERFWDELFMRTIRRDGGVEDFNRPEIYVCDRPRKKHAPANVVSEALAKDFTEIENFIRQCRNRHNPTKADRVAIWSLALEKYALLVRDVGMTEKAAARHIRDFLFLSAPFLAASRDALLKAFDSRLAGWKPGSPECLEDGRAQNGDVAEYPSKDIRRVRHSAATKNGKRIDAAWREEYSRLSEYTRTRHPRCRRCPLAFYKLVNRERVDAIYARLQGRRPLRKLIGGVKRDATGIPTMARWAVDDMTSNIEVLLVRIDETFSLIQPQIIAVMDFVSRKWVGWAMSTDRAPNAQLVCAAVLDGFLRHGVCRQLWVENGFVFGRSLNVNGKEDDQGRTVVAGLEKYGCAIHHFDKMSPTSKGELEKSFDLLQRGMERHYGYGGRNQKLASEDFKREQRLIRSGKLGLEEAKKFRYTYEEFAIVMRKLIDKYNNEPQHGHLGGLTPSEAFDALIDPHDPPIKFTQELYWYLSNEHYLVTVEAGGVSFTHYGRPVKVRGGELPHHVGEQLWALMDRRDDSMVTFMSLDYTKTFTLRTNRQPSADVSGIVTGADVLADELRKIGEHMAAVGG